MHKIRCYVAGVDDGDSERYSLSDRRSRLERWTTGWKTLSQRWPNGPTSTIERIGGMVKCDGTLLVQLRRILDTDSAELVLCRLPSESRGIPSETWRLSFDFDIKLFCHDDSQNLLILVGQPFVSITLHGWPLLTRSAGVIDIYTYEYGHWIGPAHPIL